MAEEYLIIGRLPLGKDDGKEHVLDNAENINQANSLKLGYESQGYSPVRIMKPVEEEGE